jgi:7,8-dihydroneopterin aldolase/epimerase/oxygenase
VGSNARDIVFVEGLEAWAVIGVHAHERAAPRRLVLDVEVACDAARAALTDDLALAVDYDALARSVVEHVATLAPRLLETLAEEVATRLRERFGVPWVRVRVVKPGVVPSAAAVGVVIERGTRPSGLAAR